MEKPKKVVSFSVSKGVRVGGESLGRVTVQLNDRAGYTKEEARALVDRVASAVAMDIDRRKGGADASE